MWETLERAEMQRRAPRAGRSTPASALPQPSLPAGTDLIPQLKHVVVLMMENHSYDNYLGLLHGRGDGLPLGPDGQPDVSNPADGGGSVRAHRLSSTVQRPDVPSQSWHATHHQWNEGKLDGFVTSTQVVVPAAGVDPDRTEGAAAAVGMGYWSQDDLPFYYGLARTFPLADRWFGSCLGPTFPNRRFLIAGTAYGLIDDAPIDLLGYPPTGTIFDLLTRHGISWANYHPMAPGQSKLRRYVRHKRRMARRRLQSAGRHLPGVSKQQMQKDMQFTADIFPLGIGRYMRHVHSTDQFFADADAGTLPAFSIVDPDFFAYSEENPQDIHRGESFAAEVINRVMHGPGWADTLLIWVYDEHGGYYDHVPPPPAVKPDDIPGRSVTGRPSPLQAVLRLVFPRAVKDQSALDAGPQQYDRLGFRVPAVLVSPYARPDHVVSEVFDHTSVLKLAELKWNLPPLTARDAAATAPLSALDLDGPPAFLKPPSLPEPALKWGSW
jgi:phospholipase C